MNFLLNLIGISSPSPTRDDTTPSTSNWKPVFEFLEQNTRFFELLESHSPTLDDDHGKNPFCLIKGCVQSGKSQIIHSLCLYSTCVLKRNVLVIVRNFTDDYDQFRRGFEKFLCCYQEFSEHNDDSPDVPHVYYIGDVKRDKNGVLNGHEDMLEDLSSSTNVLIALANHDQLSKINECLDYLETHNHQPLDIILDEVDQLGYSMGDRFAPQLDHLIENYGHAVFGISATLFEPLQSDKFEFKTSRVYYLTPPPNYKGITHIIYHYIQPNDGRLLDDPDLTSFFDAHRHHQPYNINHQYKHPMIALLKTERLITQQDALLASMKKKYAKHYTLVTYNGTCCQLYSLHLQDKKLVLPVCKKKGFLKNGVYTFKPSDIYNVNGFSNKNDLKKYTL